MLRIKLKPNSPDYEDRKNGHTKQETQTCEMPGCAAHGHFKAPKHRALNEYYMFCSDHIREYNQAWNFFEGMSDNEVEDHMMKSRYGFRPTWNYGVDGNPEDILREKAWQEQHFTNEKKNGKNGHRHFSEEDRNTPEFEALAIMGLEPPITLAGVKTRYKALAKKYHPDLNREDPKAEELLKKINMAYTILKLAYSEFEELPER